MASLLLLWLLPLQNLKFYYKYVTVQASDHYFYH
jgi:hypothetical protein